MLSSVLCLWSIPVQVTPEEPFPAVTRKALTGAQHGYTHRLRHYTASQLDNIMANAHAMGHEETRGPYSGLHEYHVPRKAVLWICGRPKG